MWIIDAGLSALFAGVTTILAKAGIKETNSTVATALRTTIISFFSWLMVAITGSFASLQTISATTWLFLILSGMATGASWLCYFRALQLGEVNKVVPVDKASIVLTFGLSFILLGEGFSATKLVTILLIIVGTYLMIERKKEAEEKKSSKSWLLYALLSAVFASLTTILGKIGIDGVESNLGLAIRTTVVLVMSWGMGAVTQNLKALKGIKTSELVAIFLSGLATGASWLFYYRALKQGVTTTVIAIDKLSIVITVLFSYLVFHEKLSWKSWLGLLLIVMGTLGMIWF
ncbi:transporter family protein [Enterococcus sp. PF1-24]|uniref:EamA family transporter n=1 Tax=unclassified Enterococcus TaxID=2608891 RepID=UPI002474FF39|nr:MULTISPECIES: GRP family sugar transporter [unclassified Enterococcus]MDH6365519.1 transporter family protein [Enterococcus sp. PFB1-1]MDH6402620.1 transporter family protein [Enterococcus sp. PF1-24]